MSTSSSVGGLTIHALTHRYPGSRFQLGPVNLTLSLGVTTLLGANGAGKSTLMRTVAGISAPDSGSIVIRDRDRTSISPCIGMLPQGDVLPTRVTCRQYLRHLAWLFGVPRGQREVNINRVLVQVDLADRGDEKIGALSGGMRRRLSLAAAIIHEPAVTLLDEPTAGLDPIQRRAFRETVKELAKTSTVIYSTHLLDDVRGLEGILVILNHGRVVFTGTVDTLPGYDSSSDVFDSMERSIALLMSEEYLGVV